MSDNKAIEALRDMLAGWKYIRCTHGDLYGVGWDRAQIKAEEALAAHDAAQQAAPVAVPQGWKPVPVEPTEDMLLAAELSKPRGYRDLWAAMLAAAPADRDEKGGV